MGRGTQDVCRDFRGDPEGSGVGLLLTLVTYHYFVCSHLFTGVLLRRRRHGDLRPPADAEAPPTAAPEEGRNSLEEAEAADPTGSGQFAHSNTCTGEPAPSSAVT